MTAEDAATAARISRQVGPGSVLYGSDLSPPGGGSAQGWEIFRARVPLTAAGKVDRAALAAAVAHGAEGLRPLTGNTVVP